MNWLKKAQLPKEPWQMTLKEFISYHKTGWIPSHAYQSYTTSEGISFIKRQNYANLVDVKYVNGTPIEIRESGEPLKYVKTDEDGEIIRDKNGLATYLTEEEVKQKGLRTTDGGLAAFIGDTPIGFASNEFGSAGVWVVSQWQQKGLGRYLLNEFMKRHPQIKQIGQMTNAGENLVAAYHKDLVRQAITENKPVPPEVLADYPELSNDL